MATWRLCVCDARVDAERAGLFLPVRGRQAYAFTELRPMTARERYYALHDAEWECCPWCGHDLPGTPIYLGPSFSQADGEGAE